MKDLEGLPLAIKSKMDRNAIKDFMYGGIAELIKNRQYYYLSQGSSEYSYWTKEGQSALLEIIELLSFEIIEAENKELDQRSKAIVIKPLKGDVK